MDKKKILIGLGILAAVGIGYYLWNKRKKPTTKKEVNGAETDETAIKPKPSEPAIKPAIKSDLKPNTSPINLVPTSPIKTNIEPVKPNIYPIAYIKFEPNGIHAVSIHNRPRQGTIRKDDKVKVTGTTFDGQYKVERVWIDSSNNVGALYLKINYMPTGREDRTFEKIGIIEVV
jgi:hypothetical protein